MRELIFGRDSVLGPRVWRSVPERAGSECSEGPFHPSGLRWGHVWEEAPGSKITFIAHSTFLLRRD
jgi:hypothetical protein